MDVIKYFNRIKAMDNCIRRKATGTPEEFAEKMNFSRSTLMEYIKLLKELNAPIEYDNLRKSYYYLFPCEFNIGFESKCLKDIELQSVNKKVLKKFCEIISVQK